MASPRMEVLYPDESNYVLMVVTGQALRKHAYLAASQAKDILATTKRNHLLVDLRGCRNEDKPANNFFFAKDDTQKAGLNSEARIALLVEQEDHSHDFVTTAMRNAGFNVSIFREESTAIGWLTQ